MALCLVLALALAWRAGAQPAPPPPDAPPVGDWKDDLLPAVDLHENPELVSELDRSLLEDAKYGFPPSGNVLDPDTNKALNKNQLKDALEKLRSKRKEETLAELEAIQNKFLADHGRLDQVDAQRARVLLARDWEVLPQPVRDGFNILLRQATVAPVTGQDLDWVRRVGDHWKTAYDSNFPAFARDPNLDPGAIKDKLGHWASPDEIQSGVLARPPPEEIERRVKQVDRTTYKDPKTGKLVPYPENVRAAYREVMRYASAEDSAAALRVLQTMHPVIYQSDADNAPFAAGFAHDPEPGGSEDERYPKIVLERSSVRVRDGKNWTQLPLADAAAYKKLGIPPPNVAALDPAAKPFKVEREDWGQTEYFGDGSVRDVPKPENLAALVLHETLHLDTAEQGMGANSFANEMRSFYAMNRLRLNRDAALGRTKDKHYYDYDTWSYFPVTFRAQILAGYSSKQVNEVLPDEVTVAAQLARTRRLLAMTGPDEKKAFDEEYNRRFERELDTHLEVVKNLEDHGLISRADAEEARRKLRDEDAKKRADPKNLAWDYKAVLRDQERRLLNDQALTIKDLTDDYRWHLARGLYYMDEKK